MSKCVLTLQRDLKTKVLNKEKCGWVLGRGPQLRLCVPYKYLSKDFSKEKGVNHHMDILPNYHLVSFIQTAVFGQSAHMKISQGGVGKGYAYDIVLQHNSFRFRGVKCSKGKQQKPLKVKVAQSCLTLCNCMNYAVHVILQAKILQCAAFPFSKGSSQPRDQTQVSHMAGRFFTS